MAAVDSTTYPMFANSGRPRKACSTCKSQKIRCTGERPVCKRCLRLGHTCVYSSKSAPVRYRARQNEYPSPTPTANLDGNKIPTNPERLTSSISRPLTSDHYLGIPKPMVSMLVDVYWDNLYNANLLLHKDVFLEALVEETVRPHIILSICASAAKYDNALSRERQCALTRKVTIAMLAAKRLSKTKAS